MKGKQNFIIALFILWVSAANSQTPSPPTLEVVKGGYKINLGENMLDESASKNVKIDLALVDLSDLKKAKSSEDSLTIMENIYKNPKNFSIVTGTLNSISASTASFSTKAKLNFTLNDPKYLLVLVENDGKDNSGAAKIPPSFLKRPPGKPTCSCGAGSRLCTPCCIYGGRPPHCITCAIIIKR